ncbi:ABC transporter permease [Neotabrizicola shimadae]|uniref:ABC transporter permease n=1 Tax=Neotabrizicola shimadae TaxID=2807096 RepID=A0A8G0ZX44_9RHOB|nr:ABC transporter permease [Neotabrizicola shimadae]QYZ70305.1 ABC transporter permease [Neotabrizicola shimadae]
MTLTESPSSLGRLGRVVVNNPLMPLVGLLVALIAVLAILNPTILSLFWVGNTIKIAIPLAMLAACQTLTMLTGGIDLSVGTVATITAFVAATLSPLTGVPVAIVVALVCAVTVGLVNGFGIAVCRVHPLIMTLGTALIATGCLLVYQRYVIATGVLIPDFLLWLGTGRSFGLPNGLFLFVPFAVLVIWAQRRTGFGRMLYAIGSNEAAARLSGVRVWQVQFTLYSLSSVIAGMTGLLYLGQIKTASLSLALPLDLPSVAAAVIGGTSIFGGRGGYGGTIIGALILTVLTTMLTLMQIPEGGRRILFGLIILAVTALYVRLTNQN